MTAEPEPRRDVTCCGQIVVILAVLIAGSVPALTRLWRRLTGL